MNGTKLYIDALPLAQDKMSGIGHLTLELTRALANNPSLDIKLVVPLRKRGLVARHNIKNAKIKTFPLPARVISLLMRCRLLPPVDLILGRGVYFFPNYRNWPLLFSHSLTYFHDVSFLLHPETVSPKNLKYLKNNARLWLKRTNYVLTLTESSKEEIITNLGVSSEKIIVVPAGVDTGVFSKRNAEEVISIKNKYKIDTQNYLLYVGNLEPRKNVDSLLRAYAQLTDEFRSQYSLVLIGGGGWLNEGTTELIDKLTSQGLKIIHPRAYVSDEDLPAIYSGAALLVHPAIYEGFGIPPLQAMACEVPVAASNIRAISEVVGDAALLFDPYSIEDISKNIQTALSDQSLRQELVRNAKKRVEQYSWQQAANRLTQTITNLRS